MTSLQELFIRCIFWYAIWIMIFLKLLEKNYYRMPLCSVFFQIFQTTSICFFMLNVAHRGVLNIVLPIAPWLPGIPFTIFVDKTTLIMCLLIGLVSSCVQLYSLAYMKKEESPRFFLQLSLFSSMMQILVFSGNFLMLFLAWEGIGIASFLLIGFYRDSLSLSNSVVALIANRIGDLGLLFALVAIFSQYQSLDYSVLIEKSAIFSEPILLTMCLGIAFKSAQWPLHFWLPGSMSAPTPVSALLHAATLVTAGVYLFIRILPFIPSSSYVFYYMPICSCITIVWMACVAIFQSNIKKLIAYSTISQLGYMILAVSLHLPQLGLFHLWTHGFFKSLLFLVAGIATYRAEGSQKLSDLQGVFAEDSVMRAVTLIALFSLAGIPGFSGFYSKERIIHWVVTHEVNIFIVFSVVFGAILTGIYCGRLAGILLVNDKVPRKWHNSPSLLVLAVVILSLMTIWSGPLGESLYFGILEEPGRKGWEFLYQSLETGWVLLFSGVFLISYRLFEKLSSDCPLHLSFRKVFDHIEQELYYPFLITKYSQNLYSQIAYGFHKTQTVCIEEGFSKTAKNCAHWGSNYVVMQQNGLITNSLLQSLIVGLGFLFFYTIRGL